MTRALPEKRVCVHRALTERSAPAGKAAGLGAWNSPAGGAPHALGRRPPQRNAAAALTSTAGCLPRRGAGGRSPLGAVGKSAERRPGRSGVPDAPERPRCGREVTFPPREQAGLICRQPACGASMNRRGVQLQHSRVQPARHEVILHWPWRGINRQSILQIEKIKKAFLLSSS